MVDRFQLGYSPDSSGALLNEGKRAGISEELLLAADVGVATTEKLIQRVKQRVKEEKLSESSQVRNVLKDEMIKTLI